MLLLQVAEEQQHQLAQVRSELADRLLLNRQRLEEEHATLVEAQAQVCCLSACHCTASIPAEQPILVCLSVTAASGTSCWLLMPYIVPSVHGRSRVSFSVAYLVLLSIIAILDSMCCSLLLVSAFSCQPCGTEGFLISC